MIRSAGRRHLAVALVFFLTARTVGAEDAPPNDSLDALRALDAAAAQLFQSLSSAQREKALLPFDSPARNEIKFTGGPPRAGIQLRDLDETQRALAMKLLAGFASAYGVQKCEAVSKQDPDGFDKYYLAFFGAPGEGKSHAWRLAEHHCTLVHVEVESGKGMVFGPILLGANPPVLWDDEEDAMMALYAALTPEERKKVSRVGVGVSSNPIGDAGARASELSAAAQEKLKAVFEGRLRFFAPAIQARVRELVERQGGIASMQVAFWGEATKRCAEGGLWDFKLGGPSFLCDYENTRKHIHLSLKGRVELAAAGTK